jgi:acetyltransferase-like isoleucine patch superfamily enzyme
MGLLEIAAVLSLRGSDSRYAWILHFSHVLDNFEPLYRKPLQIGRMFSMSTRILYVTAWHLRATWSRLRWLGVRSMLRVFGADLGKGALLASPVYVTWPHRLRIGEAVYAEPGCWFKHDGPYAPGKSILIGPRCFLGYGVEFNIKHGVTIGDDSLIASGVRFIDHNHSVASGRLTRTLPCTGSPIKVGRNVWIGANALILAGVSVGDHAVIGAGSLVNRDIPDGEIWAGIPARKIGQVTS